MLLVDGETARLSVGENGPICCENHTVVALPPQFLVKVGESHLGAWLTSAAHPLEVILAWLTWALSRSPYTLKMFVSG